jgi:rsbT co-antagonist protein RsbR
MISPASMDFQAYLRTERAAIVDELAREFSTCTDLSALSAEERHQTAERNFDLFFAATWEQSPEDVKRVIDRRHAVRNGGNSDRKVSLDEALARLAIIHRVFVRRARLAAEAGCAGTWDGIERMASAYGVMTTGVAEAHQASLRAAHDALKRSELRYRMLFERAPVIMQARDNTYRIRAVSDRWIEDLGYTREEIIGQPTIQYLTQETQRKARDVYRRQFQERGYARDDHYEIIKKNGEIMDVLASSVLFPDENGEMTEGVVVMMDVTERMKTERKLRESEERYRSLVEQSPLGIMVHRGGEVLYLNPTSAALFGVDNPDELVGTNVLNLVAPEFLPQVKERVRRAQEEGMPSEVMEQRLLRRDGTSIWVDVTTSRVPYAGGAAVQVVFTDVTARRASEEALRQAAVKEEIIQVQARMLQELSTPLIPIHEGIVVMPLVGRIDEGRGERILEALLDGITTHQASCAIIDITGVPEAQDEVVEGLMRAAQAARMLGAQVILTGMKSSVAQTLVQMGASLAGLVTRGTLRSGVTYALQALARQEPHRPRA